MVKFFNECAHGAVDVSGSQVFGWFKLNKSVADYNNLGGSARAALIGWARAAAAAAGHDLSPFFSTVACRTCGATSVPPDSARLVRRRRRRRWGWSLRA